MAPPIKRGSNNNINTKNGDAASISTSTALPTPNLKDIFPGRHRRNQNVDTPPFIPGSTVVVSDSNFTVGEIVWCSYFFPIFIIRLSVHPPPFYAQSLIKYRKMQISLQLLVIFKELLPSNAVFYVTMN